jgi:hypothetical protein
VWAPHHRWRSRVVTATPLMKRSICSDASAAPVRADGGPVADDETPPAPAAAPSRVNVRDAAHELQAPAPVSRGPASSRVGASRSIARRASEQLRFMRLSRLTWATLYQRVFDIAPLECSSCGGRMRFVEVIQDIGRSRSELRRRNLPDEPPPVSRARSPDCTD